METQRRLFVVHAHTDVCGIRFNNTLIRKQYTHRLRQENKQTKHYVQKRNSLFVVVVRIASGRVALIGTAACLA